MYIVIELQKTADGNLTHLETVHATKEEAESKYHTILSYAAVSELPKHSATILDENGSPLMYKHYTH
jgi:hypothetical protein